MTYWQQYGHTIVHFKSGEKVYLKREERTRFIQDWQKGFAFGTYTGVYDFVVTIKLAEVFAVMDCTPKSLEHEAADEKERKKEEALDV